MKKRIAVLLFASTLIAALTACGGGGTDKETDVVGKDAQVALTDYDVGSFTVGVPEGWLAKPTEIGQGGEMDPCMVTLFKNPASEDPLDLLSANKMIIIYAPDNTRAYGDLDEFMGGYLTDASQKDVSFLTNEGILWTAYEGTDLYDMEILVGQREGQENHCWEVSIYVTDAMGERIMSIDDPELQAVVNSLTPKT